MTGMVKSATGVGVAEAVLTGGSAFTGSMLLCLGILASLHKFERLIERGPASATSRRSLASAVLGTGPIHFGPVPSLGSRVPAT
ncbi:hypothetical protein ACFWN2_04585 [Lentzea sp. NPDC058436]|uniref:hypothetical protein n=1 Tax=Lentzea sp. NPDC058436 TaxID=3346499 RepID=UPI0036520055